MLPRRILLTAAFVALPPSTRAQPAPWVVCAVAGLQPGLAQLAELWRAQGGRPFRVQVGNSGSLTRIVEQGGPCDVLALADPQRMDALEARRLLRPDSRRNILGNDLVLVTAADQPVPRRPVLPQDIPELLGGGRLALPDPIQTAAGRLARESLTSLGIWDAVQPRLLPVAEGRNVLDPVRAGEARFGIAYATDAFGPAGVRHAMTFSADSHPPITYPFALPRRADPAAAELLAFLAGADAAAVWRRLGFAPR